MEKIIPLEYHDQPELCFHHILDGKGRLTIIRSLAQNQKLRYTDFQKLITNISPRSLSTQLRALEKFGMIESYDFQEFPKHIDYQLTAFGRSMLPIIDAIYAWYDDQYIKEDCKRICQEE